MNCSDVLQILNDAAVERRDVGRGSQLREHLDHCSECSAAWNAQQSLASACVPTYPVDMTPRIARAVESELRKSPRLAIRRSVLLGIGLVGATALAGSAVYFARHVGDAELRTEAFASIEIDDAGTPGGSAAPLDVIPPERSMPDEPGEVAAVAVDRVASIQLDPRFVVVVVEPWRDATVEKALNDFAERLGARLVAADLDVVDIARARVFARSGAARAEIAPAFGAATLIVIRAEDRVDGTANVMETFEGSTGERVGFAAGSIVLLENIAQRMVIGPLLVAAGLSFEPPPDERLASSRAVFLNPNQSFDDRLAALYELKEIGALAAGGQIVVEAVVLGSSSGDESHRYAIWRAVMGVRNTALVRPLVDALVADPSERVRHQAATVLAEYRDAPGARAALASAASADESERVRSRAIASLLTDEERRSRFLNSELPPSERLRLLDPNAYAGAVKSELRLDPEIIDGLMDIAGEVSDAEIHAGAVRMLTGDTGDLDNRVAALLISVVKVDENADLRSRAVLRLSDEEDQPSVRTALEDARDHDPDENVRRAAASALQYRL